MAPSMFGKTVALLDCIWEVLGLKLSFNILIGVCGSNIQFLQANA
jgi:hypothetical protein